MRSEVITGTTDRLMDDTLDVFLSENQAESTVVSFRKHGFLRSISEISDLRSPTINDKFPSCFGEPFQSTISSMNLHSAGIFLI